METFTLLFFINDINFQVQKGVSYVSIPSFPFLLQDWNFEGLYHPRLIQENVLLSQWQGKFPIKFLRGAIISFGTIYARAAKGNHLGT